MNSKHFFDFFVSNLKFSSKMHRKIYLLFLSATFFPKVLDVHVDLDRKSEKGGRRRGKRKGLEENETERRAKKLGKEGENHMTHFLRDCGETARARKKTR